jgi:hypothetical protein
VCYPGPAFNQTLCNQVLGSWVDSDFHAENPFSIDFSYWANTSCNPIFSNGTSLTGDPRAGSRGCTIGNYPPYAVNATSADIIGNTIKWAAQKNIRVVIKNTGHSFSGRSVGFGSLSIWTHNMRGFQFHDDWKPDGCSAGNSSQKQMAATFAAGMRDRDVYNLTNQHNAIVVAGSNPSVGIMGWFPGGGHGPLSSTYGMGADNLLQAIVVTPTGDLVTANECQHSDLYWVLRGGGAGTLGVIVEATMKAFPTPVTTLVTLTVSQIGINVTNATSRWYELVAAMHAQFPRIKDGGGQGYYYIIGPPAAPALIMPFSAWHYNTPNDTIDGLYQPIKDLIDQQKDLVNYTYTRYSSPTFFQLWDPVVGHGNETVATGGAFLTSRLLTRRALTEDVDAVARTFAKIGPRAPTDPVSMCLHLA